MENILVERPEAAKEKINTKDSFELCYLRHRYLRRVKYNPTESDMQPYMGIVSNLSKNTFFTYFNLFKTVGMYQDDVLNIGRVHLVSFLGLYALDKMKDKQKAWIVKFTIDNGIEPVQKDYEQKNKANFTMFFKQRMEDLVRVCRQKVRNIKGQQSEEYQVFCGSSKPPKYHQSLLREYEDFGYNKIDLSVFKSIRKKANVDHDATIFRFNELWYVAIPMDQRNLELEDLMGSDSNPYENDHNKRPDEIYEEKEVREQSIAFDKRSDYRKKLVLRNFIAKNRRKAQYKKEVRTAKKILRGLDE